jgi:hypothetical protein
LAALSLMLTLPLRVPVVLGLKVTLMLQLAPAARVAPQVVVSAKSPLTAILLMVKLDPPVFVRVEDWAALLVPTVVAGKEREVGERPTAAAPTPVPDRLALCVPALSVTFKLAAKEAALAGVKVTLMVHVAPPARLEPQVLD